MPELNSSDFEPSESFTILSFDTFAPLSGDFASKKPFSTSGDRLARNVNVVKPVQRSEHIRDEPKKEFSFKVIALTEQKDEPVQQEKRRKRRPHEAPVHSQTILDPHFSRHLDLKLRRLKEKEIIAERLSRRTKERQRALLAEPTVIPKINVRPVGNAPKNISISQPNLIKPHVVNLELPKLDMAKQAKDDSSRGSKASKSPDTSKKGSSRNIAASDRPLFITTVRKGEFLPPPASMAQLLGMTSCEQQGAAIGVPTLMYTYASKPKVLGTVKTVETAEKGTSTQKSALVTLASLAVAAAGVRAGQSSFGNLMTDKRIIRGTTSNYSLLQSGLVEGYEEGAAARGARAAAARRRAVARRRAPGAPGAVPGTTNRRNEPVQTDPYLEELYDKGSEMEIGIQTDLGPDRPDTPVYVSSANGNDAATQIVPGELYDFETEVEPVLQVLVDQTIEQALAECLEEEELAQLRKQAAAAGEIREQALASARHRQRHLLRIHNDKEKLAEYEEETNERLQADRRAAATNLVKTHLPPLLPAVIDTLKEQGYMGDSSPDMDETFMTWLQSEVIQEVEGLITSREVILDIVKEVIENRAELYRAMGEDETISSSVVTSETSQKNEYDQLDETENLDEIYE